MRKQESRPLGGASRLATSGAMALALALAALARPAAAATLLEVDCTNIQTPRNTKFNFVIADKSKRDALDKQFSVVKDEQGDGTALRFDSVGFPETENEPMVWVRTPNLSTGSDRIAVDWEVMTEGKRNGPVYLYLAGKECPFGLTVVLVPAEKTLRTLTPKTKGNDLGPIPEPGKWFTLTAEIDFAKQTHRVLIDGKPAGDWLPFRETGKVKNDSFLFSIMRRPNSDAISIRKFVVRQLD